MFDSDDQWPLPDYGTGPTKHVHALGVVFYGVLVLLAAILLQAFTRFSILTWLVGVATR